MQICASVPGVGTQMRASAVSSDRVVFPFRQLGTGHAALRALSSQAPSPDSPFLLSFVCTGFAVPMQPCEVVDDYIGVGRRAREAFPGKSRLAADIPHLEEIAKALRCHGEDML